MNRPPRSRGELTAPVREATQRQYDLFLGLALLAGFSPTLFELSEHWLREPWSRYSLIFVPLLAWCVHRAPAVRPRIGLGGLLVALGLAVQLLAAMAAVPRLARPALAAGLAGFLLLRGLGPPATALLACFAVPVPSQLADRLAGLPVAVALFRTAAHGLSSLGLPLAVDDHTLVSAAARFELRPVHAGLPLVVLVSGLALYGSLRRRLSRSAGLALWGRLLLAAGALQLAAVVLSALALAADAPAASAFIVESLPGWVLAAFVVLRTERSVEWS